MVLFMNVSIKKNGGIMIKIEFIKDTPEGYKIGDVVKLKEEDAKEIIEEGYAEYFKEPEEKTYDPEKEIKQLCEILSIGVCK